MGFLNDEFWPDDFWPDDYFPVYGDVDSAEELTFADMCTATLKITDGTTTVNLLDPDSGILLDSWIPALPGWKSGGIYTNNQLAEGRILQDAHRDNITESMTLNVRNTSMDAVIRDSQNLRRLLEKAVQYWTTNWQNDPVWIEAKGKEETNTRYALIVNYSTPSDVNPYAQPFAAMQSSPYLMNGLTLVLEHQPWTGNEPGTGTLVERNTLHTYNSVTLGQEDTDGTTIVTMKRVIADITHIYIYDASGPSYSANKIGTSGYQLLPAVPAVGDILYIGINSALANSGPFSNLIFDIGVAQSGVTFAFEYYNSGTGWQTLPVFYDFTSTTGAASAAFTSAGVNGVFFEQPTAWGTTAINGVTAYWVRYRVTGAGAPTPPAQINRSVYSAILPYVEINADQLPGDIPALARYGIFGYSGEVKNLFIASRGTDRGSDFSAYLNISDEQNPSGIAVAVGAGSGSIVNWLRAPTGRAYRFAPVATPSTNTVTVTINSTISEQYEGRYYAILRGASQFLADSDVLVSVEAGATNASNVIESTYLSVSGKQFEAQAIGILYLTNVELGTIEIPHTLYPQDIAFQITMAVNTAGPFDYVYLTDLILVPVDEYVARLDASSSTSGGLTFNEENLIVDSITNPRDVATTYIRNLDIADSKAIPSWSNVPGRMAVLDCNRTQRVWFFSLSENWLDSAIGPDLTIAIGPSIGINPRYLSMRGDR